MVALKINLTNKLFYTFVILLAVILLGVGVYAVVPNPGHSPNDIDWSSVISVLRANQICLAGTCKTAWPTTGSLSCTTRSAPFGGGGVNVYCQTGEVRTGGGMKAFHEGDDDWTFTYPVGTNGWQCSAEGAKSGSTCYVVCCKIQ